MRVLAVLVSRHKLALKAFEDHGPDLLNKGRMPAEIAEKISLVACTFDPTRAGDLTLEKFIHQGGSYNCSKPAPKVDGVVVLFEESLAHLVAGICNAVFAAQVPAISYLENVRKYLIRKFSILLGNYGWLMQLMEDSTNYQAGSLPIRNFEAIELRDLVEVCRTRSLEKTFENHVRPCLNRLLKLRGPKRRSTYPHAYFKDVRGRYFRYGFEKHSRYETGDPHNLACEINALFRFGGKLNQERHFNVSIGDSDARAYMNTNLPNCHDEQVETRQRTHLNMFSNDFHK